LNVRVFWDVALCGLVFTRRFESTMKRRDSVTKRHSVTSQNTWNLTLQITGWLACHLVRTSDLLWHDRTETSVVWFRLCTAVNSVIQRAILCTLNSNLFTLQRRTYLFRPWQNNPCYRHLSYAGHLDISTCASAIITRSRYLWQEVQADDWWKLRLSLFLSFLSDLSSLLIVGVEGYFQVRHPRCAV
jgi:hypothetical protein